MDIGSFAWNLCFVYMKKAFVHVDRQDQTEAQGLKFMPMRKGILYGIIPKQLDLCAKGKKFWQDFHDFSLRKSLYRSRRA
jgi:hypothetical protein